MAHPKMNLSAKRAATAKASKKRPALVARRQEPSRRQPVPRSDDRAELCSALSHDLRNPLTVIVWSAQILGRKMPPEDASRHHLDAISRAAEELNNMLHDLSDAARIADGRMSTALVLEAVDVAALIDQAVAPTRALVKSKDLALSVEVSPELGAISWDKERVTRLLAGLVANAARRTPKSGRILVQASPAGLGERAATRIVIEDGAPDIPDRERATLFDLPAAPQAGAQRKPRALSPAIGLYVAKGIIEAHGGKMGLERVAQGEGTRFVVVLPA
jgi:signal transduction histidine kinase